MGARSWSDAVRGWPASCIRNSSPGQTPSRRITVACASTRSIPATVQTAITSFDGFHTILITTILIATIRIATIRIAAILIAAILIATILIATANINVTASTFLVAAITTILVTAIITILAATIATTTATLGSNRVSFAATNAAFASTALACGAAHLHTRPITAVAADRRSLFLGSPPSHQLLVGWTWGRRGRFAPREFGAWRDHAHRMQGCVRGRAPLRGIPVHSSAHRGERRTISDLLCRHGPIS